MDFTCNNSSRDGGIDESLDVQDVRNAAQTWPLIEVAVSVNLFISRDLFMIHLSHLSLEGYE